MRPMHGTILPSEALKYEADRWERIWSQRYVKIDETLKERLSAVMTRAQPWKVLYPRLREY